MVEAVDIFGEGKFPTLFFISMILPSPSIIPTIGICGGDQLKIIIELISEEKINYTKLINDLVVLCF